MIDLGAIGDLAFVVAAYGVILGGTGLYAVTLARRLQGARQTSSTPASDQPRPSDPPIDRRA
ncbi:MAG: hypothetical protein AABM41_02160 [Chloroflexota bacterium]